MDNLAKGNLKFAFNIFKQISGEVENECVSPFCISVALASLTSGAKGGSSWTELINVLHLNSFNNQTEINTAFKEATKALSSSTGCTLSTANRLYVSDKYDIHPDFRSNLQDNYKSDAVAINFTKSAEEEMNNWVANQTKDLIKIVFPPHSFDNLTRAILVSAIYFKGPFLKPFRRKTSDTFYLSSGERKQVKLMKLSKSFSFVHDKQLSCKMLQLLYKGKRLALHLILPDQMDGVVKLKEALTADRFLSMRNAMVKQKVELTMPAFRMRFKRSMASDLQGLNVRNLLNESEADLRGVSSKSLLHLSDLVHEAYFAVEETGKDEDRTNTIENVRVEAPIPTFTVNHPFVFVLYDNKTNLVVFIGTVDNPLN